MKYVMFSCYDSKVEAFMRPWTAQTEGQAIRMFQDELEQPNTEINKHPEDYSLFKIGEFHDHDGTVTPETPAKCVTTALALLSKEN